MPDQQKTGPKPTAVAYFSWADEQATDRAGATLANILLAREADILRSGLVIALSGELGTGKTALVRATLRALGVEGPIKSPSYALLEVYVVSRLNFYHFDFYRFKDPAEFTEAGFRELFGPAAICAIEWPEKAMPELALPDLLFRLAIAEPGRRVELNAFTALGLACLQSFSAAPTICSDAA